MSCKKPDVKSKQKTKTELLTEGTWKKTSLTSTPAYDWYGDGYYATDILSIMDVCEWMISTPTDQMAQGTRMGDQ